MRVFWEHGYHATSTRELTEAMGVNPYSLYAEFGSKEALYEAAIDRYEQIIVQGHFGKLETPTASLEEIRQVLSFFGEAAKREDSNLGCLICNASTELAPTVEGSQASTARFIKRLSKAFTNALNNAADQGRLQDSAPINELANFFATLLMGLFVLMRAQVAPTVQQAAAQQALLRLDQVTRP